MRLLLVALALVTASLSISWTDDSWTYECDACVSNAYDSQNLVRTVVGEVVNGTPDGVVPDDLEVTLHIFSGTQETDVYATTLSSEGRFRFGEVSVQVGQVLVARAVYEGVMYVSEMVTVEPGEEEVSLPITVYEATEDAREVSVGQLHVFVERLEDRLRVGQHCVVSNDGARTYVGSSRSGSGSPTTWAVALPGGAEKLRFDGGELGGRFIAMGDGFGDTRAIPPGRVSVEVSFSYEVAYSDGQPTEQAFDVPVDGFVVVLIGEGARLEGAGLSAEGPLETQMGPATSYTGGPLDAGEPLSFAVVGTGVAAAETERTDELAEVAVGIAVLALSGAAVYWLWRSPLPGSVPRHVRTEVEVIAALDRDFERGYVSERVYREKREALKRRLGEKLSGRRG